VIDLDLERTKILLESLSLPIATLRLLHSIARLDRSVESLPELQAVQTHEALTTTTRHILQNGKTDAQKQEESCDDSKSIQQI